MDLCVYTDSINFVLIHFIICSSLYNAFHFPDIIINYSIIALLKLLDPQWVALEYII